MGRKEITQGLSVLLEEKLRNDRIKYSKEVELIYNDKQYRVDYMAFSYPARHGGMPYAAEQGHLAIYEVKSCMEDYKSGHGLGFFGDTNFLICPSILAEELRGSLIKNCNYIYCPIPEGKTVFEEMKDPQPYTGDIEHWKLRKYMDCSNSYDSIRKISLVYALAQMLYADYAHGWK